MSWGAGWMPTCGDDTVRLPFLYANGAIHPGEVQAYYRNGLVSHYLSFALESHILVAFSVY